MRYGFTSWCDVKGHRISFSENILREDLSVIEMIESIVDLLDSELIEDDEYAPLNLEPIDRVKMLLGKPD